MDLVIAMPTAGALSGGSQKYLEEMLPRLVQQPGVRRLRALVPYRYLDHFSRVLPGHVGPVEPYFPLKWWRFSSVNHATPQGACATNPVDLWQEPPDAVLVPTAVLLDRLSVPQVVMMRNMEPPLIPFFANPLREAFKNLARCYVARRACQHAAGVIAVSRFVATFLIDTWGIPHNKVATIYHGINSPNHIISTSSDSRLLPTGSYILAAGSVRPARGLEDAIKAVAKLAAQGISLRLAIAGSVDPGMESYHRRLRRFVHSLGIAPHVDWLGSLSREELYAWMHNSLAVVVTSRAEACPNTVLEAMICGSTVISADFPAMRELLDDTALYYSAGNISQLVELLRRVMSESEMLRKHRSQQAIQRAAQFTWERTAEETIEFLFRVLAP